MSTKIYENVRGPFCPQDNALLWSINRTPKKAYFCPKCKSGYEPAGEARLRLLDRQETAQITIPAFLSGEMQ